MAIVDYSQAIKLNSDYALAYYWRCVAYRKLGQHTQAEADYDRAVALNPGLASS